MDKKGALIAQLQCYLAKIEMAAIPAPSIVKTMNWPLIDAGTKKIDASLNKSSWNHVTTGYSLLNLRWNDNGKQTIYK